MSSARTGSDLSEPPKVTHKVAKPGEVKGEASDARDVAVVRARAKTDDDASRKKARNAKENGEMQSSEFHMNHMDGIDEDLWQHIKAQLRDAKKPVLGNLGWTVLHRAVSRGLAELVGKLLVACPFLINEKCVDGTTALHLAAENGHAAIVTQLLAACPALIGEENYMSDTALHLAARNGHAAVVTQLLTANPTLAMDGYTALHCAAEQGHAAIVTQLLAVNPSLAEARTQYGYTALHSAVGAAVTQLLDVNPSLADARTNDGLTALHYAVRGGHTATMAQLLAASPTLIDARANNGSTVLHEAVYEGHTTIVTQLLALKPALAEATALHTAVRIGNAAIVAQLLAANPALINESLNSQTALHYAAARGHATIAAQLLAAKASTEATDDYGRTALHEAVRKGHHEIVCQLLAANPALIDARTAEGSTVLHFASHDGVIAQLLAARPALLDAMINDDVDSKTALVNAIKLGQEETTIRLLTTHPNLNLICEALSGSCGWTVFHYAAYFAREKVMSWLLSAVVSEPDLEQVLRRRSTEGHLGAWQGMTALQLAAMRGHRNIVAQLLAACPSLIDLLNYEKTGLCESTMEILLEFTPALVHAVDGQGNTLLHSMLERSHLSKELIERVWKMNPHSLRAVNCHGQTPFHIAVDNDNDLAIDLFQWSLTFAEIAKVYSHYEKSVERFKPLMQLQCEELAMELLPGVVDIVFEYLGFRTVKQKASREA